MFDLAKHILDTDDIKYEVVHVPEWPYPKGHEKAGQPCEVVIRTLTSPERDKWEATLSVDKKRLKRGKVVVEREFKPEGIRARLVAMAACKAVGDRTPLFPQKNAEELLKAKGGPAMDRLFEVAQRLAGIGNEDIEEMLGNSETAPTN